MAIEVTPNPSLCQGPGPGLPLRRTVRARNRALRHGQLALDKKVSWVCMRICGVILLTYMKWTRPEHPAPAGRQDVREAEAGGPRS